jgi:excisionase family DNA binding protein
VGLPKRLRAFEAIFFEPCRLKDDSVAAGCEMSVSFVCVVAIVCSVSTDPTETRNVRAASEAFEEMTMQEFADLLNVPQPFVVSLLETGEVPFRVVGTSRFVRRSDALAFKSADDAIRYAAVRALSAESEALGLYECGSEHVADPA